MVISETKTNTLELTVITALPAGEEQLTSLQLQRHQFNAQQRSKLGKQCGGFRPPGNKESYNLIANRLKY